MCRIRAEGGCVRVGETVWNTLKGVEQKRGEKTKILKRGQAGSRGGCLKKGGCNSHTNYGVVMPWLLLLVATWICWLSCRNVRTDSPIFAASLEPLAHPRKVASLRLFSRYYFGRCSSSLAELVPLFILVGGPVVILIGYMSFQSPFLDITWMSMSKVSFPSSARLWIFLPAECFPLTYDLSIVKCSAKNHLFLGFFRFGFDWLID